MSQTDAGERDGDLAPWGGQAGTLGRAPGGSLYGVWVTGVHFTVDFFLE